MIKTQPFDTTHHLDNPEVISHYLAEALQSGDAKLILRAILNIARAGNMSKIARATGLSRTSLYWRENTSPEFTTVLKVLAARGVRLRAEPDVPRMPAGVFMREDSGEVRRTAKKATTKHRPAARKKK